jgi:hypothetical protein
VTTLKDILYTPVESLNHAVCLRRLWLGQTTVDAEFAEQRIELMFASRCEVVERQLWAVRGLTLFAANVNSSTVLNFGETTYVSPNGRSGV